MDLILIGQKYGENRQARYSRKIVAETGSDIVLLPQVELRSLTPVLCAADFSEAAGPAFERALDISRILGGQLRCYFISDPTRAYFPATTQRSSKRDLQRFRETYARFLDAYDLSPEEIPCRIEVNDAVSSEAAAIYQTAREQKASLLVVGAKGEAAKPTSLFGNLCESFRVMEKELPVMLVKQQPRKSSSWFWKGGS